MQAVNKTPKTLSTGTLMAAIISSRVLAVLCVIVILGLWLLVPNDPSLSTGENIVSKLKPISVFAVTSVVLMVFSIWCVKRKKQWSTAE